MYDNVYKYSNDPQIKLPPFGLLEKEAYNNQGFFQERAEGAICPPLKDLCPP